MLHLSKGLVGFCIALLLCCTISALQAQNIMEIYSHKVSNLHRKGHDHTALELLNKAAKLLHKQKKWRGFFQVSLQKGITLQRLFRYRQSIKTYRALLLKTSGKRRISARQRAQVHLRLGEAYRSIGEILQADSCYKKNISLLEALPQKHPNKSLLQKSYVDLGISLREQRFFPEAVFYFRKALTTSHTNKGYIYNHLGQTYQAQGRYNQAIKQYQQALKLLPEDTHTHAHILIGDTYHQLKFYDLALNNYHKALASIHTAQAISYTPTIYNKMAKTYLASKHISKSLKCSQKALITNVANFHDTINVYNIPPLNSYYEPIGFLTSLLQKAQVFELLYHTQKKQFQLQQALLHYQSCHHLINQLATLNLPHSQQVGIGSMAGKVFMAAENVSLLLAQSLSDSTKRKKLIEQAFYFSEKYKMLQNQLLYQTNRAYTSLLPRFSQVQDSIIHLIRGYESDIRYYRQQRNNAAGFSNKRQQYLTASIGTVTRKYQQLKQYLQQKYPYYFMLKYGIIPLSTYSISTQLSDSQVLVAYSHQQKKLNIYLLTNTQLTHKQIEVSGKQWTKQLQTFSQPANQEAKKWLYANLIAPISPQLNAAKQLVIAPDWHWKNPLLFELLPNIPGDSAKHFLVQQFALSYYSSAHSWGLLNQAINKENNTYKSLPYYAHVLKSFLTNKGSSDNPTPKILVIINEGQTTSNKQFLLVKASSDVRKTRRMLPANASLYVWHQPKNTLSNQAFRKLIGLWKKQGLVVNRLSHKQLSTNHLLSLLYKHIQQGKSVRQALQDAKIQWIKTQPADLRWAKWLLVSP